MRCAAHVDAVPSTNANSYFTHLYPFFWTLLPDLHTPDWLRLNSPFLTSVIAYIVSTYDPTAAHLTEQLKTHALSLAVQSFGQGLKSIEVVQAFFALSYVKSHVTLLHLS